MYPPFFPALSPLTQRLALIVGDLCRAVAARGGRDHALIPLVNLAYARLTATVMRLERLVLRLAAGRAAPVRKAGLTRAEAVRDKASFRLPRGFLWLVVRMPETSAYASQIRHLLDDPDLAGLLAAEPKAARILRPMCRMLGIAHSAVGVREPAAAGPAPMRRNVRRGVRATPPSDLASVWAALAGPVRARVAPARPARRVAWRRSD